MAIYKNRNDNTIFYSTIDWCYMPDGSINTPASPDANKFYLIPKS